MNGTATSTTQLNRLNVIQGGGKKLPLTFSDTEFERRLVALRATMEAENLDAVVVTSCHGIKYYSDLLLTSVGQYALVVTPEEHVVVTADIDAGMTWRRSYGENIVYAGCRGALQNGVHGVLRQHGIRPRRLGVECDALTVNDYAQLQSVFEEAQLVDIASVATRHRMIKSAEEIEVIKEGARIADLGGEAIRSAICEDMTEFEIALIGTEEMACEIGRTFPDSELRDTWVWLQSGINTDGPHNWPTTRRLREGDILSVGCFPVISGYQAALKRTLFLGEPDARSLELWTANVEVHRRGLELIRPGAACDEIAAELSEIYLSHGVIPNRAFGNGCPIGVLARYYGRQVDPDLREDHDVVLEPGMVVSMEPMITVPDGQPGAGGYRERDMLIVGDDGAENITGYPLGPEHNVLPC